MVNRGLRRSLVALQTGMLLLMHASEGPLLLTSRFGNQFQLGKNIYINIANGLQIVVGVVRNGIYASNWNIQIHLAN